MKIENKGGGLTCFDLEPCSLQLGLFELKHHQESIGDAQIHSSDRPYHFDFL